MPRSDRRSAGAWAVRLLAAVLVGFPGPALLVAWPAAAATGVCVGVVIDHGDSGDTRPVDTFCVTAAAGSSGLQVLQARAAKLGRAAPRVQDGLVCAIDGFPATGCGEQDRTRGGFDYWSYWKRPAGASGWTYSSTGAGDVSHPPRDGDEEGWAFQLGGKEGAKQPPLVDPSLVCTAEDRAAAGNAATAGPAASATPPPGGRAGGAGSPSADTRGPAPPVAPASTVTSSPSTSGRAAPRATPAVRAVPAPAASAPGTRTPVRSAAPSAGPAGPVAAAPSTPTAAPSTPTAAPSTPTVATATATTATPRSGATATPSTGAQPGLPPASSGPLAAAQGLLPAGVTRAQADPRPVAGGGGAPWGAMLGGVAVLGLGAAALLRARRGRSTEG